MTIKKQAAPLPEIPARGLLRLKTMPVSGMDSSCRSFFQ
jgi:hypothetical protein